MEPSESELFQNRQRSNWIRLRTLVLLRWAAIIGQTVALLIASQAFDLGIETGLAVMTIGASVLANLFSTFLFPETQRLSERQATLTLVFDVLQLGLLLFLTGGLHNPFALLMIAPVTIAATVLSSRATVAIGVLAISIVTLEARFFIPIIDPTGHVLALPELFRFGFWLAIVVGITFLAVYARRVTNEMHAMGDALLATQLALAREQKLTDLGGVVAAAAHELGTPLATIKLVAAEMAEELPEGDMRDDAALIGEQADRCRDILRGMGRAGKDDTHLKIAPLAEVVEEAAEPHRDRGKTVDLVFRDGSDPALQPVITRKPEMVHGLRNLIQNAVDFAESEVEVTIGWSEAEVRLRIADDGPGFPSQLLGRIGDPFVSSRKDSRRPGYDGMGLGLFIAKTLLERTGAELSFANGGGSVALGGAVVRVVWPRALLEPRDPHGALGENQPFLP